MVEYPKLDLVFRALGDSTRRGMLRQLARREQTVSELAEPYRMSLASASKHVKALERAGLVRRTVRGRTHFCRLNPQPLAKADEWLRGYERLWDIRLARLEELLRHPDNEDSDR
ncbi:MAG: metalloregulator ArsR/SmtB family transcription factor [Gemmatimonadota bacterium]